MCVSTQYDYDLPTRITYINEKLHCLIGRGGRPAMYVLSVSHLFYMYKVIYTLKIQLSVSNRGSELTNCTPVSLRIPIPADAKFAPTSSFLPFSSGFKYGNVGSDPSCSPGYILYNYYRHVTLEKINLENLLMMSAMFKPLEKRPVGR